jgi:hypothetical protein
MDPDLSVGQAKVFQFQGDHLMRTEPIEEHQGHDAEIAKAAKAPPELGDLRRREGECDRGSLFDPESGSGAPGSAVAERTPGNVIVAEIAPALGDIGLKVKAVKAAEHGETVIDRGGPGFGFRPELMANVFIKVGFLELRQGLRDGVNPPADEVEKTEGVSAQGIGGQPADVL